MRRAILIPAMFLAAYCGVATQARAQREASCAPLRISQEPPGRLASSVTRCGIAIARLRAERIAHAAVV